jgi:hypothetical protein
MHVLFFLSLVHPYASKAQWLRGCFPSSGLTHSVIGPRADTNATVQVSDEGLRIMQCVHSVMARTRHGDEPTPDDRLLYSHRRHFNRAWAADYLLSHEYRIKYYEMPKCGSKAIRQKMSLQFEIPNAFGNAYGSINLGRNPGGSKEENRIKPIDIRMQGEVRIRACRHPPGGAISVVHLYKRATSRPLVTHQKLNSLSNYRCARWWQVADYFTFTFVAEPLTRLVNGILQTGARARHLSTRSARSASWEHAPGWLTLVACPFATSTAYSASCRS